MTRRYIGIDPGKKGCLAGVDQNGRLLYVKRCPTFGPASEPKEYDVAGMVAMLLEAVSPDGTGIGDCVVAIENPGKVTRIFDKKIGCAMSIHATDLREGFRLWHAAAVALQRFYPALRVVLFSPQHWQRRMHEGTPGSLDRKARSVIAAQHRFANLDLTPGRKRKPDSDLAEAPLMAECARLEDAAGSAHGA